MDTIKSDEYYRFLNRLAEEIAKDKPTFSNGVVVDCNELPVGSAINWKMRYIKTKDWETIPLKAIAIAIKEGIDMNKLASDYRIELINRTNGKIVFR